MSYAHQVLKEELDKMLAMEDDERTAKYGSHGWKLVVLRYMVSAEESIQTLVNRKHKKK